MAEFSISQEKVFVRKHPNADALELANIGSKDGYQVVVGKDSFKTGDLAVYVPEGTVVSDRLLEELGLVGRLTGPGKNVVKTIRLRGQVSQGLLVSMETVAKLGGQPGDTLSTVLGLSKYIPEVPVYMSGKHIPAPDLMGWPEIESIKKHPKTFTEGEEVVVTEKVHGTCFICQLDVATGQLSVSSKGVAGQGFSLLRQTQVHKTKHTRKDKMYQRWADLVAGVRFRRLSERLAAKVTPIVVTETERNLYWRVADAYQLESVLRKVADDFEGCTQVAVYGEVYGSGVQDLTYGENARSEKPGFAAFDLRVGYGTRDQWLPVSSISGELPVVTELYRGPYSRQLVESLAVGHETISGQELHIREGVVIRPVVERDSTVTKGRAIAKVVSEAYLTRKEGDKGVQGEPTEFN